MQGQEQQRDFNKQDLTPQLLSKGPLLRLGTQLVDRRSSLLGHGDGTRHSMKQFITQNRVFLEARSDVEFPTKKVVHNKYFGKGLNNFTQASSNAAAKLNVPDNNTLKIKA